MTHGPVLVPLDGSARSEAALPAATTLARVEDRPIELLAAVDPLAELSDADRLGPLVADGLRVRLHDIAERLRAAGHLVETAVREGPPAEVILAHAEERSAHLIVMTTRGRGGLERWLVGGVADKVMRLARCPVVLFRPPSTTLDGGTAWQPTRLLVPLDGSELAEHALPFAVRWAQELHTELVLIRVEQWSAVQFPVIGGYVPNLGTLDEQAAQAATAYLQERSEQIPQNVAVEIRVMRGDPAGNLIDLVGREPADLVIMTSRGRGGFRRLMLGSVADRLVREGLPVCLVHPSLKETASSSMTDDGDITAKAT